MKSQSIFRITVLTKLRHWLLFAGYIVAIIALSCVHEVWRDEVRAWSVVQEIGSLNAFLELLSTEGHPFGWYAVLYVTNLVVQSPLSLKVASILIASIAALIFIRSDCFSFLEKTLWLFGVLPLYEYSVQCRNYGLSMLFLFLYCYCYRNRFSHPLWMSLILFLLANSSAFGFLLAGALFTMYVLETALRPETLSRCSRVYTGILLSVAGFLVTMYVMYPNSKVLATNTSNLTSTTSLSTVLYAAMMQANFAYNAFSIRFYLPALVGIIPLYCLIRRDRLVCIYLFLSLALIGSLHHLVYSAHALRHQGFVLLAAFSAIWLYRQRHRELSPTTQHSTAIKVYLLVVLLLQLDSAYIRVGRDLSKQMSSAGEVAALIKSKSNLNDSILIAEPDYFAETLRYHLDNPIYLPRENRFRSFVSFTTDNAKSISLQDLVDTARTISEQHSKPVLLLYGHRYRNTGTHTFSYNKKIEITETDRKEFRRNFKAIKRFDQAATDEKYTLYQYTPAAPQ